MTRSRGARNRHAFVNGRGAWRSDYAMCSAIDWNGLKELCIIYVAEEPRQEFI